MNFPTLIRADFNYLVFNSPPLDPIRHNIYRVNIFNIILLLKLKFPKFVENTTFEKHKKIWHERILAWQAINLHFYAHSGEVDVRTPTFGKNILPQSSGIRATFHISWCIPHYFRGLLFWFCFWSSCRNQSDTPNIPLYDCSHIIIPPHGYSDMANRFKAESM
jgi:hypothetical protein